MSGGWGGGNNWTSDAAGNDVWTRPDAELLTFTGHTDNTIIDYFQTYFTNLGVARPTITIDETANSDFSVDPALQVVSMNFPAGTTVPYTFNLQGIDMEVGSWVNASGAQQTVNITDVTSVTSGDEKSFDILGASVLNNSTFNVTNHTAGKTSTFRGVNMGAVSDATFSATGRNARVIFLGTNTLANCTIDNNGGAVFLGGTTPVGTTSIRNRVYDDAGTPRAGYTELFGVNHTFSASNPLKIDVTADANGFLIRSTSSNTAETRFEAGGLIVHVPLGVTFSNKSMTLVYRKVLEGYSMIGDLTNLISLKDFNGEPVHGLSVTVAADIFNAASPTVGSAVNPSALGVQWLLGYNGSTLGSAQDNNNVHDLYPLLTITLNGTVLAGAAEAALTSDDENRLRGGGRSVKRVQHQTARMVHGLVKRIGRVRSDTTGSKKPDSGMASFWGGVPEALPTTEGMMEFSMEDGARRWSSFGHGGTHVWVQPFGYLVEQRSDEDHVGHDARARGVVVGLDHRIRPDTVVGAALGTSWSNITMKDDAGKTEMKDHFVTLFAHWMKEGWMVDGILTLGTGRIKTGRAVDDTTRATSAHDSAQLAPSLGLGYRMEKGPYTLHPFISGALFVNHDAKYNETGAGADNQVVKARTTSNLRMEAGVDATLPKTYAWGDVVYGAGVSVIRQDPLKTGRLKGTVNGTPFGVRDLSFPTWGGAVKLSAEMGLQNNWSSSVHYTSDLAHRYQAHEIALRLSKKL